EKMAEAFREVIRTKRVPAPVAEKLGLVDPDMHAETDMVEIPMWRHGLISFPHPLLKEGLTILDTPGLNAIGNEPELTLNMLPSAQAVVFILAADTGVTKSDLEMWKHHVKPLGGDARYGRIIVLNKIDTLWDELKGDDESNASITNQCKTAAKMLDVEPGNVFPVSAQKGLLAKIRNDEELLTRSNILSLELILAQDILPRKQHLVRDSIVGEIGGMAQQSRDLVSSRLSDTNKQLKELQSLSGKNEDVIVHLMKKTREEQSTYHKSVESFQANRKTFNDKHSELLNTLSLTRLDKLMSRTRQEMSGSKFTMTLKGSMKEFFDIIQETMTTASKQTDQINMLLQTLYRQFNKDHAQSDVKPRLISMSKYKRELDRLYHEAEAYRNSAKLTVTEQAFVVKKFFISMVSHARNILFQAHQDVEAWGKSAMAPLVVRIKEHKNQMEKRL
ncbi:MAG: dynamin family protein, partial [Pseudohongiellaceae bacterium]